MGRIIDGNEKNVCFPTQLGGDRYRSATANIRERVRVLPKRTYLCNKTKWVDIKSLEIWMHYYKKVTAVPNYIEQRTAVCGNDLIENSPIF